MGVCYRCAFHGEKYATRHQHSIGKPRGAVVYCTSICEHNNHPFLPSSPTLSNMKLSKYIFLLPASVEKVSKRFDVRPLRDSELFVLYSIQYLPSDCSQQSILRHARNMHHPISEPSVSLAVKFLSSAGFITYQDNKLALAPLGREYLSAIRRFLLNKRL